MSLGTRCAAAHLDDPRPCSGALDAVLILDRVGASVTACVLHGAVLLASLDGGRVYPLAGSAVFVYRLAQGLQPFDFLHGGSAVGARARRGPFRSAWAVFRLGACGRSVR